MQPIPEWTNIDAATFKREIADKNQPAILRGLVNHWPAVIAANQSLNSQCQYLKNMDNGTRGEMFIGSPKIQGQFWYGNDMRGFNFERRPETVTFALDQLLQHLDDVEPPALYLGSLPASKYLPKFVAENPMPLLPSSVEPRIWIGNRVRVQTHFDASENIACVISGKRRFTIFPPDQVPNLYVGPLDFTFAGPPVSMVQMESPDFEKYPAFSKALEAAFTAELLPGDAIYIPYMWWHHVQSLAPFNVLVNYWWDPHLPFAGAPFEAMMHAIMSVRSLPPDKRAVWKQFFSYFVFEENGDPAAHLDMNQKGVMHGMSPQLATHIKNYLLHGLARK
jgi:hypothetical protein